MTQTIVLDISPDMNFGEAAQKNFLEALPYVVQGVGTINVKGDSVSLTVETAAELEARKDEIMSVLRRSLETVSRATEQTLDENDTDYTLHPNVTEALLERGDISQTGNGKFVYKGQVAKVFRGLDDLFRAWAGEQSAAEEFFPISVKTETLKRAGYFKTFAQHAFFVSPLELSMPALESAQTGDVRPHLQSPDWVLSPTVCHHCFESLSDAAHKSHQTITALNQCSRYEVHDTGGLKRLRHYWMREIIFLRSTPEETQSALDDVLKLTTDLLRSWGISFKVKSASDPFFLDSGTGKRMFQTALLMKRELVLPVEGKSIACGSFNNHMKTLVEAFDITANDGEIASGCVGWGYDRLILALFSQLGPDCENWPEQVRKDLGL